MNAYEQLITKQKKEYNAFPMYMCCCQKDYEEMMRYFGLTTNDEDKITTVGLDTYCYIRKSDEQAYCDMMKRHDNELKEAILNDKTGEGFIYEMFSYELKTYGYISDELEETLFNLTLKIEDKNVKDLLLHGYKKAKEKH